MWEKEVSRSLLSVEGLLEREEEGGGRGGRENGGREMEEERWRKRG